MHRTALLFALATLLLTPTTHAYEPLTQYADHQIEGWAVYVHKDLLPNGKHAEDGKGALRQLTYGLAKVKQMVSDEPLKKLMAVRIWLEVDSTNGKHGRTSGYQYHPGADWLKKMDFHPKKLKCVEFGNAASLSRRSDFKTVQVTMHELGHAYHDQVLNFENADVHAAHQRAKTEMKYPPKDWVIRANHKEFFAGVTTRHFESKQRQRELIDRDPIMAKQLTQWYGKPKALFRTPLARELNQTLRTAKIFSDHMVLQQQMDIPIWGWAKPGAKVMVRFAGQTAETITDAHGRWKLTLKPIKGNFATREMVIESGQDRITHDDVMVGEVWFAGGQSNMNFTARGMQKIPEGKAMVAAANHPKIRFCRINEPIAPAPKQDLGKSGKWDVCQPDTVIRHSAVCFVFARRLREELKVPIGIIDCSWGGTPIEPYIPATAFVGHPTLEKLAKYAKSGNIDAIKKMPGGTYVRSAGWLAGAIYNSRIAPVAPYGIRGAIWYQAESNCGKGEDPRDYEHKMRALVRGWRTSWGLKDMPVYYVQLPQWKSYAWTYAREEQRRAMTEPNTGMAVTLDLDNHNDIHPPNKIDVGERLARWPLAKTYSKKIPFSGPLYKSARVDGKTVIVTFDQVETGLMAGVIVGVGKIEEAKEAKLGGFELVGADGQWHIAEASIKDGTIVVTSGKVPNPLAVRYACYPTTPKGQTWNLYNKAGLPASPFCSDWTKMAYDSAKNPR